MAKLPSLPWHIRLVALVLAIGMSLYILEVHRFGGQFGVAIGNYLRGGPEKPKENGIPSLKGEPGMVPVTIIGDKKPAGK